MNFVSKFSNCLYYLRYYLRFLFIWIAKLHLFTNFAAEVFSFHITMAMTDNFNKSSFGVRVNKELIGNLIALLAHKCAPLCHTKLIKMMYLIDEKAIEDSGIPITWLDYKVWQYGPVAPAVFFFRDYFGDYVEGVRVEECGSTPVTIIKPLREFDDSEFSDYDLEIIDKVIEECKDKTARELVDLTHKAGGPWDVTKKRNDLDFSIANISSVSVDMGVLVESSASKQARYKESCDHVAFMAAVKSKAV